MSSTISGQIIRISRTGRQQQNDMLAAEEPLEIRIGQQLNISSLSVTMRTPGHDPELAAGFLFTEGMVQHVDDIEDIHHLADPNIVQVNMAAGVAIDMKKAERNFYTTSSCGVCGKSSIEAVRVHCATVQGGTMRVAHPVVCQLPETLRNRQQVFASTGGLHASALFTGEGSLLMLREDVGRHNALDKLIGHCLLSGHMNMLKTSVLLLSGRASFELIQKAAVAGVPVVAAIGAPSSLAVQLAAESGITLCGFVKASGFNIYAHPHRIV